VTSISVIPQNLDITIYAGDDFNIQLEFRTQAGNPRDVSGTWRAQIRSDKLTDPVTSFVVTTTDAASGVIYMTLDGNTTAQLLSTVVSTGSFLIYDLELTTPAGAVNTIIAGQLHIVSDVTH
jgi:hypothetical protein